MVSIKDIARDCGVSIATVSKALNNHSDVSDKTKKAIIASAKRLGYYPNSQARALKTNKTFNIGVLYSEKSGGGLTHSFFSKILDSFKIEAEKMGYDLTLIGNKVGEQDVTFYEHCRFRNVDGVAVVCVDFDNNSEEVDELLNSELPIVVIDYVREGLCSVISDNTIGMKEILKYVYSQGHRKIAYIYGDSAQVTTARLDTFYEFMHSFKLNVNPNYVVQCKYHDPEATGKTVADFLEKFPNAEDRPTCIILPDDFAAIGAYNSIRASGLNIPNDISIAGYDGITVTQVIEPKLTTYRQNTDALGRKAAHLLQRLMFIKTAKNPAASIFSGVYGSKPLISEIPLDDRVVVVKGSFIQGETIAKLSDAD